MNSTPDPTDATTLRRDAEARLLRQPPAENDLLPAVEQTRLLHELSVHEIELEMQNEELRRTLSTLETERAHNFDFYNLAPVGYLTLSERGLISEANLTAATLLGMPRGLLLKQPLAWLILREDLGAYHRLCEKLIATHEPQSCELRLLKQNDEVFPVHVAATITPADGAGHELRLVLSDITEQKRAEETLRQSEERFRNLLRDIPDMAVQGYDTDGITTYWNHASEVLYGYTAVEAVGRSLLDLIIPAEMKEGVCQAIQRMAVTRQPIPAAELSLQRKDGSRVAVFSSHAIVQLPGHPAELFCLDVDLTARKLTEAALRESEDRFRSLFASSLDSILLTAPDGQILAVNDATCRLLQYTEEEIKRLGRSGIIDASDGKLAAAMEERNRTGSFKGELTFIRKGGEKNPCEVSSSVFTDKDGNARTSMIVREITARKQAEAVKEKLAAQHQQLQKAESLGRMAGAVAHHFNNQLHVVMMRLELALLDLPKDSQVGESLSEAMQAAHKAAEVSTLMLTYVGQSCDKKEALDLAAVCTQSLHLLRGGVSRRIVIEPDLPSPGPTITANSIQIQRILLNLATNASEASADDQGVIRLSVITVPGAAISATNRFPVDWHPSTAASYARLEVADAGCGIAGPDIEKLFDPFYSSKFTGRGLGLPVVLGLVRSLDGGVTVESELGRGSSFRVYFPLATATVTPRAPLHQTLTPWEATSAESRAITGTVLVVEGEETMREVVTLALQQSGFAVLEAADGGEAVRMYRQRQAEIDCVLCAISLRGMDGWETLTALREITPGLPVILASGYSELQVMAGHHPERPQVFLQKPYEVRALKNAVTRAMAKKT